MSIRTVACVSLGAMVCLSGCKVGPEYSRPATTMPTTYRELGSTQAGKMAATTQPTTQPTVSEASWWRRFDDPELSALVEKAVVANNSVAIAAARVSEARAQRQMAQSLLSPQVGVGASALRYRAPEAALNMPTSDANLFQFGFDATWAVDVFGGNKRAVESAKANEEAVASERRGVVLMVAAETARAYLELRGMQTQLQVSRATLEEQRQTLKVTEDKQRNGLASDLEVVRARTEVNSTAAEIPPIEQAIRQYIHVLSTLLGLEPTALASELENPTPIPDVPSQFSVGIPSDLLRRRPDIQAAERQLAAATAQVGVATAQLFPQVTLGGAAGMASSKTGDLFNGNSSKNPSNYYAVGPVINWSVFDGGRRKAGIKMSEAQVDAMKAFYQDTVLRAFREVESSLVSVDRGRARLSDLKRLSASAREAADIALRDYERGILDQLTVLDAQRQANRADMLLAQGQMALAVDVATLYKALGGGWEIAEPKPATQPTKGK